MYLYHVNVNVSSMGSPIWRYHRAYLAST